VGLQNLIFEKLDYWTDVTESTSLAQAMLLIKDKWLVPTIGYESLEKVMRNLWYVIMRGGYYMCVVWYGNNAQTSPKIKRQPFFRPAYIFVSSLCPCATPGINSVIRSKLETMKEQHIAFSIPVVFRRRPSLMQGPSLYNQNPKFIKCNVNQCPRNRTTEFQI
jgi:hypothetical protein